MSPRDSAPSAAPYRHKKQFGQHFLHDPGILDRIVQAIRPQPGDTLVEIGPGMGALTRPLLEKIGHLHVVEVDRDLAAHLRAEFDPSRLTVHEADVLKFDFASLGDALRVVGNLPYNISSPILFHLMDCAERVRDMHFMLQKEVVDRMAAEPASPDYGRLSVMLQARFHVEKLFRVPPGAFNPPPKVDSAVVRLIPLAPDQIAWRDRAVFADVVARAFGQRRKTLRNTLRGRVDEARMQAAGIDPNRRGETLSVAEFAALANSL